MTDIQPTGAANPLLGAWSTPFEAPPFALIAPEHFPPAFEAALAAHRAEIEAIASDAAEPGFDNTIAALERAGQSLDRLAGVFYNLTGAHTNEALKGLERDLAPVLSRHHSAIALDARLFRRIQAVVERQAERPAGLGLDDEQAMVLERYHTSFMRRGAGLEGAARERFAAISERLATLGTAFSQNVLADESGFALPLSGADLEGLPDYFVASAAQAAAERGLGGHVVTLSRSSLEPFLQFSPRRDLRERAFQAWTSRGESAGATDNRALAAEMVSLRAERARLLGFSSFAAFKLDDAMAKTPDAVLGLLESVWPPARTRALEEEAALQRLAAAGGGTFDIAPWDWRYYAERRRREEFDFDEADLKAYLALDQIIEAAFDTATRLFGVQFQPRPDVPVYHPDVRAWAVTGPEGEPVGLFLGDYFARASKRSGAWMSGLRGQERLSGDIRPIIVNVMNFAKPQTGEPCLLGLDEARTLFHEFGHALHGLLSDVTYPMIAGTSVARDFVEFPSQLYEHWLETPEVLRRFAVHHRTGKPIPDQLMDKLEAARRFNQGFATVEYVASALVDLDLHLVTEPGDLDIMAFERQVLKRIRMPASITMRHRTPHFTHVFAGEGYSAGYYGYLWSEVLDADGFGAFADAGDVFDPATARRLKDYVYAAGGRHEPDEAYRLFRGHDPDPSALLAKRGLTAAQAG